MASAKLANSTVNHSHRETAKMKPAAGLPFARRGLKPKACGQNAAHVNREHDRVLDHVGGVSFLKDSRIALRVISPSNNLRTFVCSVI